MTIHHVSSQDHSRLIAARVGDELVVELPELSGAGYEWHLDDVPSELELLPPAPPAAIHGIGVNQLVMKLRVLAPFQGELHWRHYRRWEGAAASVDRLSIRVEATR